MYVCLDCLTIYSLLYPRIYSASSAKMDDFMPCVLEQCNGEVVEIDELIAPAVLELNRKGYRTSHCCSGHWGRNSSFYCSFQDGIQIDQEYLDQVPEGMRADEPDPDHPGLTIRRNLFKIPGSRRYDKAPFEADDFMNIELLEFLAKLNRDFYEWAKSLPDAAACGGLFEDGSVGEKGTNPGGGDSEHIA